MSTPRKLPLTLFRFKKFLSSLIRNKMAFTGIVLLVLFTFVALGASLITPYDPQGTVVSAPLNEPSWVTLYKGTSTISQNGEFTGLHVVNSGSTTATITGSNDADLQFSSSGGTVVLEKTLSWPYNGPAKRFLGRVIARVSNAPVTVPLMNVTVYVERLTSSGGIENRWDLWGPAVLNKGENAPSPPIDSVDSLLNGNFGYDSNTLQQVIFCCRPANFVLGIQITVPPGTPTNITLSNFRLLVYGNTWGLFGTDDAGRDIFTQLVYGARLSMYVGLLATFLGIGIGLIVGLLAGYLGKIVDEILMRFTDMMLVIPGLPLLIVLATVLGSSLNNVVLILGLLGWMGFARLVRSQVLSLRERPFIEAAKASGAGTGYTLVRHVFPNVVSLTYVNLALSVPAAIVGEAALSFLGLGDVNVVTWGRMLSLARNAGGSASNLFWWWVVPPGIAIAAISLSFILVGYSLDELFNPKLRKRR